MGTGGGPTPGGNTQPAPMVMRPRGLGEQQAPPVGGVPQGVSRQAVENALMLVVDRLRGTVAVVGDLAQQGQGASIQALISDARDYSRVLPVLRAIDPNAQLKTLSEDRWPPMAVRVA